jgi:hypothetical protein
MLPGTGSVDGSGRGNRLGTLTLVLTMKSIAPAYTENLIKRMGVEKRELAPASSSGLLQNVAQSCFYPGVSRQQVTMFVWRQSAAPTCNDTSGGPWQTTESRCNSRPSTYTCATHTLAAQSQQDVQHANTETCMYAAWVLTSRDVLI